MRARLTTLICLLGLSTGAGAADFVGAEACRSCHLEAYEQWRDSQHARAMGSLSNDQKKDARCTACHARDAAMGGDAGVTCETCHGAGEYYSPSYVMRDAELARAAGLQMPDAKACLICHDASSPSLGKFDPVEKLKAIDHWSKSRAARERKKADLGACPRGKTAEAKKPSVSGTFLANALRGSNAPGATRARRATTN